jgi:putative molybdopterin biosynthesis protein
MAENHPMNARGKPPATDAAASGAVRLGYAFSLQAQGGADLDQPLFAVLEAVRDSGSIKRAATALGRSYRYVWGALRAWEKELDEPLIVWAQGEAARLTDFGHRLLWAELRARKRLQPHIEALRANLEHVVAEARDQRLQLLTVCASHDLALRRLREHAAQEVALSFDLRIQGSIDSVRSLNAGRCLVAGFHVPALSGAAPVFATVLKPLLRPGLHKLIGCSRRMQGLMMRREHAGAVGTVGDLAGSSLRFVNRQVGSGTRLLMDHLLQDHGLKPRDVAGYENAIEESHVAVATCVASGVADVGPGIEAAALEFGLHFLPLVAEDYFLACLKPNLEHPAVLRLRRLLAGDAWAQVLGSLPGYSGARAPGAVLSLTAELPWWRFMMPKGRAAGSHERAKQSDLVGP